MNESYTCSYCGEAFETTWTDEEAYDEATQNFPTEPKEALVVVCDDCYKLLMAGQRQ